MNTMQFLMMTLPIVFMLHDFEEVIMFRPWLDSNRDELKRRFSRLAASPAVKRFSWMLRLSTSAYAAAICFMFTLISAASLIGVYSGLYGLWFGAFMCYFLHLFMHIAQWVVYRRYVPVIITSLLSVPYCIYVFVRFLQAELLTSTEMVLWTLTGMIVTVLSIPVVFFFARRIEKRFNSTK